MRGCGDRQTDAIYLESRLCKGGLPIEEFIIDPPIDCEDNDIKFSRSFQIFQKDGVNHLIDWVGESFYESPWDFIEECRVKGMSRRISKTFDFSILTLGQSQVFFAHKKAIDLKAKPDNSRLTLINRFPAHEIDEEVPDKDKGKYGFRKIGDLKYRISNWNPNIEIKDKDFRAGLFLRMPITNMVYVRPADDNMLKKIQEKDYKIEVTTE